MKLCKRQGDPVVSARVKVKFSRELVAVIFCCSIRYQESGRRCRNKASTNVFLRHRIKSRRVNNPLSGQGGARLEIGVALQECDDTWVRRAVAGLGEIAV